MNPLLRRFAPRLVLVALVALVVARPVAADETPQRSGTVIIAGAMPDPELVALSVMAGAAAFDIFIGANAVDYSGYPDCRPEFLTQFERLANLATKAAVEGQGIFRVHAPLLNKTKAEIIREGLRLGVDYGLTLSCYDPDPEGRACGRCDSCRLRLKGFEQAAVKDPVTYQELA